MRKESKMEKELEAYLEKNGWYLTAEKALDLTEHVLIFLADKMEKDEPHAKQTIIHLHAARNTVALALED
jgi:hypothetical protein